MKSLIKQVLATISLIALLTVQVFASSSVTFYHHDALGSVVAATDQAGAIVWQEEYQPYGGKITPVSTDEQTGNSDWYTGKSYDESLDLTYFGARWYDAKQGRFLSIDPAPVTIENIHSFNRYHYANNNPYKYVDPDGEFAITALVVLSVAISTYMTGDNAIGAYEAETSVFDDGVSVNGLKAAGKSLAVDATISLATAGVLSPIRFLGGSVKRSADGRLRNSNGSFAYDGGSKKGPSISSHGNTRTPDTDATLYGKFDAKGKFEKWGISQDASTRYSAKELAGGRIKEYRRGPRDQMLDRERRLVGRFPGPKNNESWAGAKRSN
jgi:RHS repeat-associated protein